MIRSILDTDLYKFSTSYAYFKLYPYAEGTFKFNDRNKEDWRGTDFLERMQQAVAQLGLLHLTYEEADWCTNAIPYIPRNYWEWLLSFRFTNNSLKMWLDEDGVFQCEVTDLMYKVTLWEIAILATYAKIRNSMKMPSIDIHKVENIIDEKIKFANVNNLPFSEFGTRRRFSNNVHEVILSRIKAKSNTCQGTSNVYYAMRLGMKPIGTFPHEWVMFHAATFGYKRANYLSLEDWIDVYDGNLGTALIDTYTTKSFLHTLTRKQAHLLSGFRQDSGDEFMVGNMIIKRLQEFGIDPKSKLIVFSNALTLEKYKEIYDYFNGRIKVSAGIGTNLTCDIGVEGFKPANIVMKLSKCRISDKDPWEKCIKISDDAGKHTGDEYEFEIAQYELHLS